MICHPHRWILAGLLTAIACSMATPGEAQCLERFVHNMARDWKRNNCWPEPFVCPDRMRVRSAFVQMVANGWERQNLLSDHHFEPSDGKLNHAGKLRVQWILHEAPPQHRIIYVKRSLNAEQTASRVDSVQQVAMELASHGDLPRVVETNVSPVGWPAERVDAIGRKFQASTPEPRLPCASGTETN